MPACDRGGQAVLNELGNECATGNCGPNEDADTVCLAALTADGGSCSANGASDATCKSGYCNIKGKCAKVCTYDESTGASAGCSSSEYCNLDQYVIATGRYACEPKGANGDDCSPMTTPTNPHVDTSCTSGFCDTVTAPATDTGHYQGKCAAKVAADAACPNNVAQQCQNTQYGAARAPAWRTSRSAAACTQSPAGQCAVGSYCQYNSGGGTYSCQPYGEDGDTCDFSNIFCNLGLTCNSDQSELKCREPGKFPDGAYCAADTECLHGWCTIGSRSLQRRPCARRRLRTARPATATDSGKDRCVGH